VANQESKRKLAAILSADVKGYSRLMSQDEEGTVKTLKQHRLTISKLVNEHGGRVVDSPGDNILAEFTSVVDAVKCAVKIQETLKGKNDELPESRRMEFRIGVNLGDVIEDEDRVYGDGVNIAARLEGLSEPGGICISGTVYDHVDNKFGLEYEYLGVKEVKNITKPMRVYRVRMASEGSHPGITRVLELPDNPSIAVLPFVNISGHPEQEFLSDGLTEDLITFLSKIPQIFVIARNSTFIYKGRPVKVQDVARDLGVKYVLEGNVQRAGDRVRITAQLIDALKGHHLWADRYDRDIKDLFAILDDITKQIITSLQVKLTHGETARVISKGTQNLDAYLKVLEAFWYNRQSTRETIDRARRLAEEAIAMEPGFAFAYYVLGGNHMMDALSGLSGNPRESLELSNKTLQKAIEIDGTLAGAIALRSWTLVMLKQYDEAVIEVERAYKLAPGDIEVMYFYGTVLSVVGRAEEAILHLKEALRLNPIPPNSYLRSLGMAYREARRYEEAISYYRRATEREPNDVTAQFALAATCMMAGREEEARQAAKEALRINPKFSVERYMKTYPLKDPAARECFAQALRKAGMPG
jgi:adenylate cyclase